MTPDTQNNVPLEPLENYLAWEAARIIFYEVLRRQVEITRNAGRKEGL